MKNNIRVNGNFHLSQTIAKKVNAGKTCAKLVFKTLFIFLIMFTSCNSSSSISQSELVGTEWSSDDGKIKLEFKTETLVVRDNSLLANYTVEKNIITISNSFVKIPLTYKNGKLTGILILGQTNVLTKRIKP